LPEGQNWVIVPDESGNYEDVELVMTPPPCHPEPKAKGLNEEILPLHFVQGQNDRRGRAQE